MVAVGTIELDVVIDASDVEEDLRRLARRAARTLEREFGQGFNAVEDQLGNMQAAFRRTFLGVLQGNRSAEQAFEELGQAGVITAQRVEKAIREMRQEMAKSEDTSEQLEKNLGRVAAHARAEFAKLNTRLEQTRTRLRAAIESGDDFTIARAVREADTATERLNAELAKMVRLATGLESGLTDDVRKIAREMEQAADSTERMRERLAALGRQRVPFGLVDVDDRGTSTALDRRAALERLRDEIAETRFALRALEAEDVTLDLSGARLFREQLQEARQELQRLDLEDVDVKVELTGVERMLRDLGRLTSNVERAGDSLDEMRSRLRSLALGGRAPAAGVDVDDSGAAGALSLRDDLRSLQDAAEDLRRTFRQLQADDATIDVDGVEVATERIAQLRRELLQLDLQDVDVDVDLRGLEQIRRELARVRVEATGALDPIREQLANIRSGLDRDLARKFTFFVDADGVTESRQELLRLERELRELDGRNVDVRVELDGVREALRELSRLQSKLRAAQASASGLGGAQSGLNRLRLGVLDLRFAVGALGGIAAFQGLERLGEFAIDSASKIEQLRLSLNQLSGGDALAASAGLDRIIESARETPFAIDEVADAARRLVAFQDSFGTATGNFAGDVEVAVAQFETLGGALALIGNTEALPRVVKALGDIGARGKLTGEEIRQLANALPGLNLDRTFLRGLSGLPELLGDELPDDFARLISQLGLTGKAFNDLSEDEVQTATARFVALRDRGLIPADVAIQSIFEGLKQTPGVAGALEAFTLTIEGSFEKIREAAQLGLGTGLEDFGKNLSGQLGDIIPQVEDGSRRLGLALSQLLTTGVPVALGGFATFTDLGADFFLELDSFLSDEGPRLNELFEDFADAVRQVDLAGLLESLLTLGEALVPLFDALAGGSDVLEAVLDVTSFGINVFTDLTGALGDTIDLIPGLEGFGSALESVAIAMVFFNRQAIGRVGVRFLRELTTLGRPAVRVGLSRLSTVMSELALSGRLLRGLDIGAAFQPLTAVLGRISGFSDLRLARAAGDVAGLGQSLGFLVKRVPGIRNLTSSLSGLRAVLGTLRLAFAAEGLSGLLRGLGAVGRTAATSAGQLGGLSAAINALPTTVQFGIAGLAVGALAEMFTAADRARGSILDLQDSLINFDGATPFEEQIKNISSATNEAIGELERLAQRGDDLSFGDRAQAFIGFLNPFGTTIEEDAINYSRQFERSITEVREREQEAIGRLLGAREDIEDAVARQLGLDDLILSGPQFEGFEDALDFSSIDIELPVEEFGAAVDEILADTEQLDAAIRQVFSTPAAQRQLFAGFGGLLEDPVAQAEAVQRAVEVLNSLDVNIVSGDLLSNLEQIIDPVTRFRAEIDLARAAFEQLADTIRATTDPAFAVLNNFNQLEKVAADVAKKQADVVKETKKGNEERVAQLREEIDALQVRAVDLTTSLAGAASELSQSDTGLRGAIDLVNRLGEVVEGVEFDEGLDLSGLFEGAAGQLEGVEGDLQSLIQGLGTVFQEELDVIGEGLSVGDEDLDAGTLTRIFEGPLAAATAEGAASIETALGDIAAQVRESDASDEIANSILSGVFDSLVTGINEGGELSAVVEQITAGFDTALIGPLTELEGGVRASSLDTVRLVGEAGTAAVESVGTAAEGTTTSIAGLVEQLAQLAEQAGVDFGTAVAQAMAATREAIAAGTTTGFDGALAAVQAAGQQLNAAGNSAAEDLVMGFEAGIVGRLSEIVAAEVNTIAGIVGPFALLQGLEVGREFGRGFALGIASQRGQAILQARRTALAASAAMRSGLRISSPSKVTAKIGGQFVQGFTEAVRAGLRDVASATGGLADAATGAFTPAAGFGPVDVSGVTGSGIGVSSVQTTNTSSTSRTTVIEAPITVNTTGDGQSAARSIVDSLGDLVAR